MDPDAQAWFERRTTTATDWPLARVLDLKGDTTVAVVIPARNEAATIADIVSQIRTDLAVLVDELVVMDSLSTDATATAAAAAGAIVHSVADVRPDLGVRKGKGEALWKSTFVTTADIFVFIDADLTEWGTHFVTALVGPMLASSDILLSKGFYDRILDMGTGVSAEGGRVTELVARPWLSIHRPALSAVVQPLAGEWAIRRSLFETLTVPVGYGIEIATLVDTHAGHGLDAIAQVDLGRRAHHHQHLHDLAAMATELLAVVDRRTGSATADPITLPRLDGERTWTERAVPTTERPPAATVGPMRPSAER